MVSSGSWSIQPALLARCLNPNMLQEEAARAAPGHAADCIIMDLHCGEPSAGSEPAACTAGLGGWKEAKGLCIIVEFELEWLLAMESRSVSAE